MEIKFTELYQQNCINLVNPEIATSVIEAPENEHTSSLSDDSVSILTKEINTELIMVFGVIKENVFEAMFAFPIPQNLKGLNPLKALELFATEFGLKFQIGHKKGKFMYHEAFWSDSNQIKLIDGEASEKGISSFFVKIEPHGSKSRIEVHTAFALNLNKYEQWLQEQRK